MISLSFDANLPERYVKSATQRMALYKRISLIGSRYDLEDMTDELLDRYGDLPRAASNLLSIALEFFVATFKTISDDLEYRSNKYHWSPAKTVGGVSYTLLRHTPKSRQRLVMYKPFWNQAEARVYPEVFNEQYLKIENFEGVQFWQNANDGAAIKVKPAIPDTSDPTEQTAAAAAVAKDYVLGMIFDEDAIMVDYQLDEAAVTPKEARKHYHNIWWTFRKNAINDFTENAVVFIMEDPASP